MENRYLEDNIHNPRQRAMKLIALHPLAAAAAAAITDTTGMGS